MGGFIFYDLLFLGVFLLFVIIFLSTRKKNLERHGILFLYKTRIGINFIEKFAKKFEKILRPTQYLVLASGYILTVIMMWLLIKTVHIYLTTPIARVLKAPPVFPVIPYFPRLFGLESFFPPLFFTYFIIALAIVAVSHEFAHGIFARLYKFKIHSTGFAFLGPILGAFVEPDEKQMNKASKFKQMVVLAAGTFANVVMALLFFAVMALFFTNLFVPAGVKFSDYAFTALNMSEVSVVGNSSDYEGFVELESNGKTFFTKQESLKFSVDNNLDKVIAYEDTPAFRAQLRGAITEINGNKVRSIEELSRILQQFNPGDEIKIKTALLDPGRGTVAEVRTYDVTLGERNGKAALGIVFIQNGGSGITKIASDIFSKVKSPVLHYESKWGDFGWFVYYLLWWVVVINFLVALFNMLPLGILDGGRFFYLTVWGITRREKWGRRAYKFVSAFIILLLVAMMARWFMIFF